MSRRHMDQFAKFAPHQKKPRSSIQKTPDRIVDQAASKEQKPSLSKIDYQNVSCDFLYYYHATHVR